MDQHLLSKGPLLNENGELAEAGYAFSLVKEYNRDQVKLHKKYGIKEWDYYFFHDNEYGVAITVADNSYLGLVSLSLIDIVNKKEITKTAIEFFTFGEYNLPSSSKEGQVYVEGKNYRFSFEAVDNERRISVHYKKFNKDKAFKGDFVLKETTNKSMVIATHFKQKGRFYYNQKINLLHATGSFKYGALEHELASNSYGVLDWGRGVWSYRNTWYWASLNGEYQGHLIGFNLGYGFGDTSAASENMFFYDKEAFKLDNVKFIIPTVKGHKQYLNPWRVTSDDGSVELTFAPVIDRHSNTNAIIIQSNQHQIFGRYTGYITIKDKKYRIENLFGFAERVRNRW